MIRFLIALSLALFTGRAEATGYTVAPLNSFSDSDGAICDGNDHHLSYYWTGGTVVVKRDGVIIKYTVGSGEFPSVPVIITGVEVYNVTNDPTMYTVVGNWPPAIGDYVSRRLIGHGAADRVYTSGTGFRFPIVVTPGSTVPTEMHMHYACQAGSWARPGLTVTYTPE